MTPHQGPPNHVPPSVILNIRDGIIQDVFASDPEIDVVIVAWDGAGADEDVVPVSLPTGQSRATVGHPNIQPLHLLAGSDVEAAIDAACAGGVLELA